jgi:hypothetical protein
MGEFFGTEIILSLKFDILICILNNSMHRKTYLIPHSIHNVQYRWLMFSQEQCDADPAFPGNVEF